MAERSRLKLHAALWVLASLSALGVGCVAPQGHMPVVHPLPRELNMVTHPAHVIQPGDSLTLTMQSLTLPKPPYRLRPLDILTVEVLNVLPREPLDALQFVVEPEGWIRFPGSYPPVRVAGLSLEEAQKAIQDEFEKKVNLKNPVALVTLEQGRETPEVPSALLVKPDGTVSLGPYGNVYLAGLTEAQARVALEEHLGEFLMKPELTLEVGTDQFWSFYLILDQPGFGEQVSKLPLVGNETVLDVLSSISGVPVNSSRHRMWVARPAPADAPCDQILPVDWVAITQRGSTVTNYQILPGDRLYVKGDQWYALTDTFNRVFTPFERLATFASNILRAEEEIRAAVITPGGLFSGGFFGFGFPGVFGF